MVHHGIIFFVYTFKSISDAHISLSVGIIIFLISNTRTIGMTEVDLKESKVLEMCLPYFLRRKKSIQNLTCFS